MGREEGIERGEGWWGMGDRMGRGEGRVSEEGRGKKEEIWKKGRMKSRGKGGKEVEKKRTRRE
jgi:hypothetical protein